MLVGGGLQNTLAALALSARRPRARVVILEREGRCGGNHTWSFHPSDVADEARAWLAPLVVQTWHCHEVRFPDHRRQLEGGYATISSDRLDEVLARGLPGVEVRRGAVVAEVAPGRVQLASGEELTAEVVIDARGPTGGARDGVGWQKFVGLEVTLARPMLDAQPILMDATVEQLDGYRFVYTLPLAPDRALIEDTYYAADPDLDVEVVAARVRAYAAAQGLEITGEVRREHGALPIPWTADDAMPLEGQAGAWLLRGGYAGGWFHPTTGYSLPVAVRLASFVAARSPAALDDGFAGFLAAHRRQARFARLLNRMLFRHFAPADRWRVLSRFYRLPEPTVRRFYALESSRADRLRILCGRPPRGFALRGADRLDAVAAQAGEIG